MKYDPSKYDGLLNDGKRDVIVADANAAELHTIPIDVRQAIAKATRIASALLEHSRPGAILEANVSEGDRQTLIDGYRRGIDLLCLPRE